MTMTSISHMRFDIRAGDDACIIKITIDITRYDMILKIICVAETFNETEDRKRRVFIFYRAIECVLFSGVTREGLGDSSTMYIGCDDMVIILCVTHSFFPMKPLC